MGKGQPGCPQAGAAMATHIWCGHQGPCVLAPICKPTQHIAQMDLQTVLHVFPVNGWNEESTCRSRVACVGLELAVLGSTVIITKAMTRIC